MKHGYTHHYCSFIACHCGTLEHRQATDTNWGSTPGVDGRYEISFTDRQTDRQTYRQTDTQTYRHIDTQTDRQTDKQTELFNGLYSRTTWVSRHQKGETNLDFTAARYDGVTVALAEPYANHLHLAADRQPHQYLTTVERLGILGRYLEC